MAYFFKLDCIGFHNHLQFSAWLQKATIITFVLTHLLSKSLTHTLPFLMNKVSKCTFLMLVDRARLLQAAAHQPELIPPQKKSSLVWGKCFNRKRASQADRCLLSRLTASQRVFTCHSNSRPLGVNAHKLQSEAAKSGSAWGQIYFQLQTVNTAALLSKSGVNFYSNRRLKCFVASTWVWPLTSTQCPCLDHVQHLLTTTCFY